MKGKRFKKVEKKSLSRKINDIEKVMFVICLVIAILLYIYKVYPSIKNIFSKKNEDVHNEIVENIVEENIIEEKNLDPEIEEQVEKVPEPEATPEIKEESKPEVIEKKVAKEVVSSRSMTQKAQQNNEEWIQFQATAYCGCSKCCGKSNGITASGTKATAGRTVAMSKNYAFGTRIEIKGMGTYVVEDRGGAINGNKIDIYFSSHQEALNFGRKTVYLKVIK